MDWIIWRNKLTLHPSRSWPVGHKSLPLLCSTCSKPPRQTVCSYIRRYKSLIWKTVNLSTKKASSWMALRDQLATCLPPATNLIGLKVEHGYRFQWLIIYNLYKTYSIVTYNWTLCVATNTGIGLTQWRQQGGEQEETLWQQQNWLGSTEVWEKSTNWIKMFLSYLRVKSTIWTERFVIPAGIPGFCHEVFWHCNQSRNWAYRWNFSKMPPPGPHVTQGCLDTINFHRLGLHLLKFKCSLDCFYSFKYHKPVFLFVYISSMTDCHL